MIENLNGKVALITGAGQGIGRAVAMRLAQEKVMVCVNDIRSDRASRVVSEIEACGGHAFMNSTDVSSSAGVKKMVADVVSGYGRIDILINNARAEPPRPQDIPLEDWWDIVFAISLKGAYLCSMACFPYMMENKYGRIINISSVQAYIGKAEDDWIAYSTAKSGMTGLTRSFARKGMALGITANIVAPDYIETEVMTQRWSRERLDELSRSVPVGRSGKPEDVVKAVLFLVDSDFITGETIFVNGGRFFVA